MNTQQITEIIIFSVFAVPGVILGIVFFCGNGADFIAGYNSLSPKEREKWDEKALCRTVGILMFVMIGGIELCGLGAILNVPILSLGGTILLVATVGGLVYINKSKRFKKK